MPRAARVSVGDQFCRGLNGGNGRQRVFFKDGDYQAFAKAMAHASVKAAARTTKKSARKKAKAR